MSVEESRLRANGLDFRVLSAGSGPVTFLCLHGFPEGAESWTPQLEALAAEGFRVVAADLRGYGGTEAPEPEAAYAIEPLVADVVGLVEALGDGPVHLAGHDWGALVGWPAVSQRPDLFLTWTALSVGHPVAVARVTASDADQQARFAYIKLLRMRGKAEEVLSADGFMRLRRMYELGPNPGSVPADVVDRFLEGFARPGRLTAALNYYRVALPQIAPAMGEVTVPTILVWGAEDPALGRRGVEATAEHVRGPFRLVELAGAGHWLQFERPGEVTSILAGQAKRAEHV